MTRGSALLRLVLTVGPPAFWVIFFLLIPLVFVFTYGFSWYDESYHLNPWFDPANYADAVRVDPGAIVIPLLLRTFGVAVLTTLVSLAIGYCMAYYIARIAREKWRGLLMGLVVVPFWISFIVRIYAIFPFTNPGSFIHTGLQAAGLGVLSSAISGFFRLGEPQMVIFTLMYVWIPFMILPLFASLSKLDQVLLEAAYDLGASRWRAFLHVTLPLTYPAMIVGSILIFITTVGAFIEPDLVGGGAWQLIGNYIWSQYGFTGGLPQASASAFFLIVVTVLLINLYRRYAEIGEIGSSEVRSRILLPLWNQMSRLFRLRKPSESAPVATMPDGGTPVADIGIRMPKGAGPFVKARWERVLDVIAEKAGKFIIGGVTTAMLLMFFVPLAIVAIFSFNSLNSLDHFGGFSLDWWFQGTGKRDGLLQDSSALLSIFYSTLIALVSSLLAVCFGLLAAFAITRHRFRFREPLQTSMYLGLVIPSIVMGLSLAVLFRFLNYYVFGPLSFGYGLTRPFQWDFGLATIIVGHTTFNIPLATLVLIISFREFDRTLEEAAMNLGADEVTTFLRVTLPNIVPGIISAILLGFTFSFDELPVTLFLAGGGVQTVPMIIYGLIAKKIITPRVNAMSTVVLVLSFVFVLLTTRLGKRGGQLFRI
jgi:ABC-type spermidine/putrescine transport system permease subunit II